jgi:ATP-binding cassette, subfamily A (ABC1), member 3
MRSKTWDKFELLLWKNWTVQLRHKWQTVFEIFMPIFVCLMPIIIRYLVDVKIFSTVLKFEPQSISNFSMGDVNPVLAYSPKNDVLDEIVNAVAFEYGMTVQAEANADKLERNAMKNGPFASIEFDDTYDVRNSTVKKFFCKMFWFQGHH